MRAWSSPDVPRLPVTGPVVRLHDTATGSLVETRPEGPARLYAPPRPVVVRAHTSTAWA